MSLTPPKNSQSSIISVVENELYPVSVKAASTFYYFHALDGKKITDITCIETAEANMLHYIDNYTLEHNVTLLKSRPLGAYLSTLPSYVRSNFRKDHGTIVIFELAGSTSDVVDNFPLFTSLVDSAVNDACTASEQALMIHGHIGVYKIAESSHDSLKHILLSL